MKKLILFAFLCTQVACSGRELAAGAIGVGVGIGIGNHFDRDHRRDHHRGRHDRWRDGRHDGRHGRGRWHGNDLETMVAGNNVVKFSNKHQIPLDAAKKIQRVFADIPQFGIASFANLGLNKADLKAIANQDLPTPQGIKNMSERLDISEAQTRDLLISVRNDFNTQAADINSPYWRSCMKEGEWKTPQNSFCQQADWEGCSPRTGAMMCY